MEQGKYDNKCPMCGRTNRIRKIRLIRTHLEALKKAYLYAITHKTYKIRICELDLTNQQYTTFSVLVYFGLLYKSSDMENGTYGVPIKRIESFLQGGCTVAEYIWFNPLTKTHEHSAQRIIINQIPRVSSFLDGMNRYIVEYKESYE